MLQLYTVFKVRSKSLDQYIFPELHLNLLVHSSMEHFDGYARLLAFFKSRGYDKAKDKLEGLEQGKVWL